MVFASLPYSSRIDYELRIMDIDVIEKEGVYLLAAAYSNSTIKVRSLIQYLKSKI